VGNGRDGVMFVFQCIQIIDRVGEGGVMGYYLSYNCAKVIDEVCGGGRDVARIFSLGALISWNRKKYFPLQRAVSTGQI